LLYCPFCRAEEDDRLNGVDEEGNNVVLLMFNCPFFLKLAQDAIGSDEAAQNFLDGWRKREGDAWLDSLGPVLKRRELRNIERSKIPAGQSSELTQK